MTPPTPPPPQHQIRALHDETYITLYQAYSASIAEAAVRTQKLTASPEFSCSRMTWVKPSWCWMMYRSGFAGKDARQTHILALKMTHAHFRTLLSHAIVVHNGQKLTVQQREKAARVQWDPERDPFLNVLPYRSIQIGIGPEISRKWAEEWVAEIEDVTESARALRDVIEGGDGRREGEKVGLEDLVGRGLMPVEREYDVGEELRRVLEIY